MYKLSKAEREFREKVRGQYPPDHRWYAVMTHCGREYQVRDRIVSDFVNDGVSEVLIPEIRSGTGGSLAGQRRPDVLFRCYVFLRCRMSDVTYMTIAAYQSVYSILGRAFRIPSVIEDTEMTYLKGVLATRPAPLMSQRLNIGSEAVVTKGLMEGMRGRVIELNSSFAKLETTFSFFDNGTSVIVSVPLPEIQLDEAAMFSPSQGAVEALIQSPGR